MNKIINADESIEIIRSSKNNKNQSITEEIKNLKFDSSISEIKDNKDILGNILNVSYLSIINKKEKENNFSGTTKNDEYRSTDNASTKSKKKKLIKVFYDRQNFEMDKTLKYDFIKNSKDSSTYNNDHKNKISNFFSNRIVNKISEEINLNKSIDSIDYFETETKGLKNNNFESFLSSENKLKSLFLKFEKSNIRKNSNFSLNLNFNKDLLNDKVIILLVLL